MRKESNCNVNRQKGRHPKYRNRVQNCNKMPTLTSSSVVQMEVQNTTQNLISGPRSSYPRRSIVLFHSDKE